jgi:hypothetical protein
MENVIFFDTITRPKGSVYGLPIVLIILFILLLGLAIGIVCAIKYSSIAIKDGLLVIRSFPYGRKIPIASILTDEVGAINIRQNTDYAISIRTNGIGLPNFHAGWMKLNNGKKALVFLTDKENVVLLPTKDFVVLFSTAKAHEFVDKMKGIM